MSGAKESQTVLCCMGGLQTVIVPLARKWDGAPGAAPQLQGPAPGPSPGAGPQNGQIIAAAGVTWSESGDWDVTGWADGDSDLPGSTRVDSDRAVYVLIGNNKSR